MTTPAVKNHRQLTERLEFLEEKRKFYRERVIRDTSEILDIIKDPVPLIKQTVKELASDPEFRSDLLKMAFNYIGRTIAAKFNNGNLPSWLVNLIQKVKDFGKPE